ncbi:pectinesterase family protein [Pedobacter sp. SYSU D00535]|uniref:pectinesterase family protein n=1 Tax=Pedobacter sp. SYSU D00535 TaxID=2810308 RepID=UPI001A96BF8F|nr:pectinesterase family protein [Pedobacter sp. SYSU D00535]
MRKILNSTLLFLLFISLDALAKPKTIVVAADGSGDVRTVQDAFNKVPADNKREVIIYIKNGTYKEKLHLPAGKDHVTLVGEDRFKTILTFDDHAGKKTADGKTINTRTSYSLLVSANNFYADNLTFENNAGFAAGQAVAVEIRGDKAIFVNCRFLGNQDVLFPSSGKSRQFYKNCYIEGTTDFIFGDATVWFQQCQIHCKKNSHITAASTPKAHQYGYVFYDCTITADTSVTNVSLGRPWQPDAAVAYLYCYIDRGVRPEGWSTWNNKETFHQARYAEYMNYGPRGNFSTRVSWAKQLTDQEAEAYTIARVLNGWVPAVKCLIFPAF